MSGEKKLSILVTAQNLSKRVLGGVKGDINGIEGAAKRAGTNVGRNVGIAVAAVGAGIAVQVKAGVDSLVELERVENLTEAALESTGNKAQQSVQGIRARAEAMEHMTGVDDKVIQNAENLLLTFANIGPKAFEPTLESAINLNAALGGNDESLQGVLLQVAKAVNDPVKGMTALRRSGVSFTDAQIKQVKEMVKANDLMGAQAIVLGELETQFGGAAEAANQGATRAQRRWADAVEDIQKSLATGFMPLIERVSGKMSELVADPAFLAGVENFGEVLASGFDAAIDFAEGVDWAAVGSALQTAGTGARMAMDAFLSAPPWLQTAILTGWGLNKLTGGGLGSIVGALGSGLIKGVLGMNAGVVNIKAGTVIGGGGGGLPGGKGGGPGAGIGLGLLGTAGLAVGALAGLTVVGTEVHKNLRPTEHSFNELAGNRGASRVQVEGDLLSLSRDLGVAVSTLQQRAIRLLESGDQSWSETVTALRNQQSSTEMQAEQARSSDVAMLGHARTEAARRFTQAREAIVADRSLLSTAQRQTTINQQQVAVQRETRDADRAMLSTAAIQTGIQREQTGVQRGILAKKSSVTAVINTTVNVSLQEWQRVQVSSIRANSNSGGFI